MATRLISEYMNSGELKDIATTRMSVADNIQFLKAKFPEAEDMFMRFGPDGLIAAHRVPDQDVHMDATYTQDVIPPEAWTEYFNMTTTHEVTPENGTLVFNADAFVLDNKDRTLWIRAKVDGNVLGDEVAHSLWKDSGTDHQQILISWGVKNTVPAGSVVTLELYGESDGIQINGTYQTARLRLTAAQAAPVEALTLDDIKQYISSNDGHMEILATNLANQPSKADIDQALIDSGITVPLPNKMTFNLYDGSKMFYVTWFDLIGKYGYEKLTLK